MYKTALQQNYLFKSNRGMLEIADLFDLPLSGNNGLNLDNIAKSIAADIKADGEQSFVSANVVNPTNANKLEIVKDIIADNLTAVENRANAKAKAEKRHKLLDILSRKQDASDEAKTEAEILAELEALDS